MKKLIIFISCLMLFSCINHNQVDRQEEKDSTQIAIINNDSISVCDSISPDSIQIDEEALHLRQKERKITGIVIHCSATAEEVPTPIDTITKGHLLRGFRAIGYHYYITRDGVIHRGRDLSKQGAHVAGHNATTIGICYEGGLRRATKVKGMEGIKVPDHLKDVRYDVFRTIVGCDTFMATAYRGKAYVSYDTRTPMQKAALTQLTKRLQKIYGNIPVCGHRDYSPDLNHDGVISKKERIKECPCYDVALSRGRSEK